MPRKAKHKSRRGLRATQRKRLTTREKMDIVRLRDEGLSYNNIANHVKCCYQTVEYTLNTWVLSHPEEVRLARAKALENLAGKTMEKAILAMESVTPDSMRHDRIEVHDKSGKLIAVNHSGPTGLQAATTAGIFLDKALKLQEKATELREESGGADKESADTVAALVISVRGKAKDLNIDINLGEIEDRLESVEADYEVVEDNTDGDPDEE